MDKTLNYYPRAFPKAKYNGSSHTWLFPSGAKIVFGAMQHTKEKYDPLPKALTPLTEGVTPDGQKLSMGVVTATVKQYGGFIELSDILLLTAIDNNLVQATKLLGAQAGRTLDTITREVLNGGTNVDRLRAA